jgi:amino acid permease
MTETDEKQQQQPSPGKTRNVSLLGAIFNLTKSAVGVGTLFLHSKLAALGFIAGPIAIVIAAVMGSLSNHLLSRMAHNCDTGDYFVLGRMALGERVEKGTAIALLLFLFAGLLYYCMFVGDYVRQTIQFVFKKPIEEQSVYLTTAVPVLCVMFPLACLRDLSALAVSSIVGMVSMLGVVCLVVSHYFTSASTAPTTLTLSEAFASENVLGPAGWSAFGGIIFAFVNHFTMVSLVPVMERPTPARRATLNLVATAACLLIYLPCAVCGYLMFSKTKAPTILDVPDHTLFAVARGVVALVIAVSYPLLLDPARSSLASMLPIPDSPLRHYSLTLFLTLLPLTVLFTLGSRVDNVLSLLSGACGSYLVFIAPGVFFLCLQQKMVVHGWERVGAYALIVFGALTLITGTYSSLTSFVQ